MTGFLLCGHLWADRHAEHAIVQHDWARRADILIPTGTETATFTAARIFAAVYPEAVRLAQIIATPAWRQMAVSEHGQQRQLLAELARRLHANTRELEGSNAVTHWMVFDAPRPPSPPDKTFPQTREYHASRPAQPTTQTLDRQHRGAMWFAVNRRGGNVILFHRHIRPVLVRPWATRMDGITATISASRSTNILGYPAAASEREARIPEFAT